MAEPISTTMAIVDTIQKVKQIADFFKSIKGLFKGKEVIPYTAQELADMSFEQIEQMVNSPNLYGDGGNEGQLEAIEAQFEDAVSKVQGLEESPEKTRLLNEAVRILPRGFTQLTETDIMPDLDALSDTTQDDDDDDDAIVTIGGGNDVVGTTPTDTNTVVSSETPEDILAKYKDRADPVTDMLRDYKQDDGSNFPVNVLLEIISDYAVNRDNKDAQAILATWNDKVAATKDQILANEATAGNTAGATSNVPTGNVPTGNVPTGNVPTGNVPTGNVPTGNVPTGNVPAGGVVSQGSVLDQSGTGTVNVDDKVPNIFNIPIPGPQGERGERGLQGIQGIAGKNAVPIISTPISDSYLFQMDIPEVPVTRGTLVERAMIADNNWRNIV
tara:strand:- start:298 stop:1455 length:1158 start_codon:yes stop_codon:yes gene_type:complete